MIDDATHEWLTQEVRPILEAAGMAGIPGTTAALAALHERVDEWASDKLGGPPASTGEVMTLVRGLAAALRRITELETRLMVEADAADIVRNDQQAEAQPTQPRPTRVPGGAASFDEVMFEHRRTDQLTARVDALSDRLIGRDDALALRLDAVKNRVEEQTRTALDLTARIGRVEATSSAQLQATGGQPVPVKIVPPVAARIPQFYDGTNEEWINARRVWPIDTYAEPFRTQAGIPADVPHEVIQVDRDWVIRTRDGRDVVGEFHGTHAKQEAINQAIALDRDAMRRCQHPTPDPTATEVWVVQTGDELVSVYATQDDAIRAQPPDTTWTQGRRRIIHTDEDTHPIIVITPTPVQTTR